MAGNDNWYWIATAGCTDGTRGSACAFCDITVSHGRAVRYLGHRFPDGELKLAPTRRERNVEAIVFIIKVVRELGARGF